MSCEFLPESDTACREKHIKHIYKSNLLIGLFIFVLKNKQVRTLAKSLMSTSLF